MKGRGFSYTHTVGEVWESTQVEGPNGNVIRIKQHRAYEESPVICKVLCKYKGYYILSLEKCLEGRDEREKEEKQPRDDQSYSHSSGYKDYG